MSWFTKYRPTTVAGLHLQSVRQQLQRLMKSGRFPQALLFSGPKGTGKTSSARIIGAMLNDPQNYQLVEAIFFHRQFPKERILKDPDPQQELAQKIYRGQSYVVHEMDAASNRRIDDIRALKDRLYLPPQEGKIAVYILDEVHMLTNEAFNALLKVLEEPPEHVVFILATTEKHKIPATIVSRCQEISFHKAGIAEIIAALEVVVRGEKLTCQPEALRAIAQRADGSFRDAVKLLESAAAAGPQINLDSLQQSGLVNLEQDIIELIQLLINKEPAAVAEKFTQLRAEGINSKFFYQTLLRYLHGQLLINLQVQEGKIDFPQKIVHFLLNEFNQLTLNIDSPLPLLDLEIKFLDLIFRSQQKTSEQKAVNNAEAKKAMKNRSSRQKNKVVACQSGVGEQTLVLAEGDDPATKPLADKRSKNSQHRGEAQTVVKKWSEVLQQIKANNFALEILLRSAKVKSRANQLIIQVFYSFHRDQLQQKKLWQVMEKVVTQIAGGAIDIKLEVVQAEPANSPTKESQENELIDLAKNILV